MRVLFLFLDGVGLGDNDSSINPFAAANMPTLRSLLGGHSMIRSTAPFHGEYATLLALDACLGVSGLPQSATGQAVLLTGRNIAATLGYHYGPKPNPQVAAELRNETLFANTVAAGKKAALLNAYPPRYFHGIESGKRIYSSIPLAVTNAGLPLFGRDDLVAGRAMAADFTGRGWRNMLRIRDTPVLDEYSAGTKLAELARKYDFALFEYWASDYAGHKQEMAQAIELLELFDKVLAGLVATLQDQEGLILISSDHGNLENLTTRRHTFAPVPALIIGDKHTRANFAWGLTSITDITPAIWNTITAM